MNLFHLQFAINIMERAREARSLNMCAWQCGVVSTNSIATTEAELHSCGNVACFAGHVAVSGEFALTGGVCNQQGSPQYKDEEGDAAIALWLDIPPHVADALVHGDIHHCGFSSFYACAWESVTADMVIAKLEALREGYFYPDAYLAITKLHAATVIHEAIRSGRGLLVDKEPHEALERCLKTAIKALRGH